MADPDVVVVRSRPLVLLASLGIVPLILAAIVLLVPADERSIRNAQVLVGLAAAEVILGFLALLAHRRGGDSFRADDSGLSTWSPRHGARTWTWEQLVELGWVTSGEAAPGGLAGRTRTGGRYQPGGPVIAGWLSQPATAVRASDLQSLQALCLRHDVRWREYAAAEVMQKAPSVSGQVPFCVDRELLVGATFRSVPEVSAEQRAALTAALRRVGAPREVAIALAHSATVEPYEDVFMLCLDGNCAQVADEADPGPVEHLAENAAADNAEAFDRQKRGEPGYSPGWDLPDRRPRGQVGICR